MPDFLARPKKTKTNDGETVEFKAKRRPQRRVRVKFKSESERSWWEKW